MRIEFNALGAVSDIITNDEALRQGNVGVNTLTAVFEGKSNLSYNATFNYTRSDDGRLKDIPLTPTANAGEYYYKFSNPWFFALYGETTLTVYLKNSANEIVASGQITFSIEQTDFDTDTNITYTEYQALLDSLAIRQIEYDPNNVRGYDSLAHATTDLPNLVEGQIIIVKGTPTEIYQVQAGELVDLIVNKATSDSLGNVIKDSYVSAVYPTYNTATDKLFIETYSVEDVLMANNEVILPKATTTKNGLMAKEDKVKVDGFQSQIDSKQSISEKNQPNGYAGLDSGGKVPSTQLPSYVDDILEFANLASFPATGESGIIYVALDTNLTYRWSGSAYVEISPSLALGETSSTAYRGDRGKTAYDHSQVVSGNPHEVMADQIKTETVDKSISNLISNGDLLTPSVANPNIPNGFSIFNLASYSLNNGVFTFTSNGAGYIAYVMSLTASKKYYIGANFKALTNKVRFNTSPLMSGYGYQENISQTFRARTQLVIPSATQNHSLFIREDNTSGNEEVNFDGMFVYDVDDMISKGLRNDKGVLFSALTNAEIKDQLDKWIDLGVFDFIGFSIDENGYIVNNVKIELTKKNDDLIIKNEIDGHGFSDYTNATGTSVSIDLDNGILTGAFNGATAYQDISIKVSPCISGDKIYVSAEILRDNSVLLVKTNPTQWVALPASSTFEKRSFVITSNNTNITLQANNGNYGVVNIQVKNLIAINLTRIFGVGKEPKKEEMDNLIKKIGYVDDIYGTKLNSDILLYLLSQNNKLPEINLPAKIYMVEGREMNIYFSNVFNFLSNDFYIDLVGSLGVQQGNRFYIPSTFSASNTYALTFNLRNSYETLYTKSISLITKTASVGDGVTKKMILIGDSTVAGGEISTELGTLFGSDVMTLTQIGTQGTTYKHEGHGGWTIDNFANDASVSAVTNPFYNSTTSHFDISYYLTNNSFADPDYFFIQLGINDVVSSTDIVSSIKSFIADCDYIISNIHTYNSSIKVVIGLTIPPSISQDAFGKSYGLGLSRGQSFNNVFELVKALISEYDGREAEGIYVLALNAQLDTENNMQTETVAVNARNSTTVTRQSNGVHPAITGYYQMADAYFSFIKCQEN